STTKTRNKKTLGSKEIITMAYFRKPRAPRHSAYTAYQPKPLRLITTAYQTAGITPPDFGDDRAKQLHQELTVEAAAEHYAQALYDGDKPKALEQAIKAISRATA